MSALILLVLCCFAAAAAITGALVLSSPWHRTWSGRPEIGAVQHIHQGEVPRVGGLTLYLTALGALSVLSSTLSDAEARLAWSLWACLSAVAMIGVYEDFRRSLLPGARYMATAAAAFWFSIANQGLGIESVDIGIIDAVLSYKFASVAFFIFAVTGATHAFNIIDGQHGLSSGTAIIALGAIAAVAELSHQPLIRDLALIFAAANAGFLLFNFPFGRIFLGDGGAYLNGATIGCLAVLVVNGSAEVSPWFALLTLAYPVTETMHSMLRRRRAGRSVFSADVEHLHHLYRLADTHHSSWLRRSSAPRLWGLTLLPASLAIWLHDSSLALMLGFIAFTVLYAALHTRIRGLTQQLAQ